MSAAPPPILAPGAPCTCAPGRYVRYVLPRVPGLHALVSCREVDGVGFPSVREHAPPPGAVLAAHVPAMGCPCPWHRARQ